MPPVVRVGDVIQSEAPFFPSTHLVGSATVLINGLPVVRLGDPVAPYARPSPPSTRASTVQAVASPTVMVEGLGAARLGDTTSMGGICIGGSADVVAN